MTTPWLFDELAHAGAEHLDRSFVERYDRKQGFPDPADDIEAFVAQGLTEQSTLIDLGAGTGQFALAAARRFGHITAVDVSPTMVEVLGEKATTAGLANIEIVHAGFLGYEHPGPKADGVYSRNALHHLPDLWKGIALDRAAGMLRPRGVLVVRDLIFDFRPSESDAVLAQWLASAPTDPALGYTAGDLAAHLRTEFSTYRWLFEPMLEAAGLEIMDVRFRGSVFGSYTCVKR
jgi:ubiquinone/menaquinone biosynthesis C-methylase UbiE